jgi:hypothetical protein
MNDNELLLENRALGFVSAETAPAYFRARILEVRRAIVEKRSVPAPTREYIAGAEQRSMLAAAALRHVTRLFPTKTKRPTAAPTSDLAVLKSIAHRQGLELHEDRKILSRARLDAEARVEAEKLADERREINRSIFPWEYRD